MKRGRINFLFLLLRSAQIKRTEYAAVQGDLLGPIGADNLTIDARPLLGALMIRYNIRKSLEKVDPRTSIKMRHLGSVKTPLDLSSIDKRQAVALGRSLFPNGAAKLIWQCAKCQSEYPGNRTTKLPHRDPTTTPRLVEKIGGETIDCAQTYREGAQIAEPIDPRKTSRPSHQWVTSEFYSHRA